MIKKLIGLWPKTYSYLKDDNEDVKRQKVQKSVLKKGNLNFKIIKTA